MLLSLRLATMWHMDTRKRECTKTQGIKPCINDIKLDSIVNINTLIILRDRKGQKKSGWVLMQTN